MKSIVKSSFFTTFILLILGILLFIKSDDTIVAISYMVGGAIIVLGVLALVRFFTAKDKDFTSSFDVVYGIVTVIAGIFVLSNPKMIASVIPFIIGLCILIKSSFKIAYALDLKKYEIGIWKQTLITSIISAMVGIIMLFNPFKTSVVVFKIIGAGIIIYSILDIISTFQLRSSDIGNKTTSIEVTSTVEDYEDISDAEIVEDDAEIGNKKSKKGKRKGRK